MILTGTIVAQKVFSPTASAKVCLVAACVLQLVLLEPSTTWGLLVPHTCLPAIGVLSYFDLVLVLQCAPLVLYFVFIAKEYERQKQKCMVQFVMQSGDVCDLLPFTGARLLLCCFVTHSCVALCGIESSQSGISYRPF